MHTAKLIKLILFHTVTRLDFTAKGENFLNTGAQ